MSTFTQYDINSAQGESKELLQTIQQKYGFIPNLFGYMAEAPATLKAYLQLNELLQETSFTQQQLQIALLTASLENDCHFCAAAHTFMAKSFSVNAQTLEALLSGGEISEPQEASLVKTVREVIKQRGWVSEEVLTSFFSAGFSQKHYLELQLVVTIKTLSNYINHQTKPEPNKEFLSR